MTVAQDFEAAQKISDLQSPEAIRQKHLQEVREFYIRGLGYNCHTQFVVEYLENPQLPCPELYRMARRNGYEIGLTKEQIWNHHQIVLSVVRLNAIKQEREAKLAKVAEAEAAVRAANEALKAAKADAAHPSEAEVSAALARAAKIREENPELFEKEQT